jgi:hemoglobin/transferrin/lactoferrin receptor protein
MRSRFFFLFLIFNLSGPLFAQKISAVIVDASTQQALVGVNIWIKDSEMGTVSDQSGRFSLENAKEAVLQISHLAYRSQQVPVSSLGQQTSDTIRLQFEPLSINEELAVVGERGLRNTFESPNAIEVLSRTEIMRSGLRSSAEALQGSAGVFVQKTNHGGGSPIIRGLMGNQILMLMDGFRLNNSTYRFGPNQYFNTIDLFSIDRIELLRGSAAVRYGSDAMGGAIQVWSNNPNFHQDAWQWSGRVQGRWVEQGMEQSVNAALQTGNQNMAFHAGFSARNFGDLLVGGTGGKASPSSYKERSVDAKSRFRLGAKAELVLAYNGVFQRDIQRYDQYMTGAALALFSPQDRQMGYARFNWQPQKPWLEKISLGICRQDNLEKRSFQRKGSSNLREEQDQVRTWGQVLEWHAKPLTFWTMISGAEVYLDQISSTGVDINTENLSQKPRRGLYPDQSAADNLAVFQTHRLRFGAWEFNLGYRYNRFSIRIPDATFGMVDVQPDAMIGHFQVYRSLGKNHAVYAGANQGFRAPNVNDLSSFGRFDFGIEVPSYGLSPEKSVTYELGYKHQSPQLRVQANVYYTALSNGITRIPGSLNGADTYNGDKVFQKANTAESFIRGAEAELEWRMSKKFSLRSNLSYTFGQNTSANEPMRRIPPLFGASELVFQANKRWRSSLELWYAGQQDRLAAGDKSDPRIPTGGTPAWHALHLRSEYQWGPVRLQAVLNNILNADYRTHGSGIKGQGRSIGLVGEYWF